MDEDTIIVTTEAIQEEPTAVYIAAGEGVDVGTIQVVEAEAGAVFVTAQADPVEDEKPPEPAVETEVIPEVNPDAVEIKQEVKEGGSKWKSE